MLGLCLDLSISSRTVNEITVKIGCELQATRDQQADWHHHRPIPQPAKVADPPVSLACVQVDGGRIQTRTVGRGSGVHDPHWRESKNAGLYRMVGETFAADPHPDLPSCFSSRKQMLGLLHGLEQDVASDPSERRKPDLSWRPASVFRSCLSSLCDSNRFGQLMSAEAEQRGFYTAQRKAFLGDGLPYNWTIWQKYFESFTPILDFIHPIERLHELSQVLWEDSQEAWQHCQKWVSLCWQGDVVEVLGLLTAEQLALGDAAPEAPEDDPRRKLSETIGYLCNNVSRMDYPRYRAAGLPVTSCLIESQVKEMNARVKGTEKFWNDGLEAEAILQVRAAILCDDDRLRSHIHQRPGSPYSRPSRKCRKAAVG